MDMIPQLKVKTLDSVFIKWLNSNVAYIQNNYWKKFDLSNTRISQTNQAHTKVERKKSKFPNVVFFSADSLILLENKRSP